MIIFLVLLAFIAVALFAVVVLALTKRRGEGLPADLIKPLQDMGAVKAMLEVVEANQKQLQQGLEGVKAMVGTGSRVQDELHKHIEKTLSAVENIKTDYETSKQFQQINRESLQRLENIIAGTKTKGIAGENILKDVLAVFPPEMVTTNFRIKGREVEFGFVLSDKTVVAIDVKWPSTDLLEDFSKAQDEDARLKIARLIERDVNKRVSEVAQYIEPGITAPWAVCAIPDAAYNICRDAHLAAYKRNVILISYGMALPYLLTFFSLHMQYSGSVDMENLERYLIDIKRNLTQMSEVLENKIERSVKTLENASGEYREIIGSMKGSVRAMESQRPAVKEGCSGTRDEG